MWTQGLFISMYDKIHYKKKKKLYSNYTLGQFPLFSISFIHRAN